MATPDRSQFAQVAADAATNHRRVMNNAMVVYDLETGQFSWQSSLSPLGDTEIVIDDDCKAEYFGEEVSQESLEDYLENDNDDYWQDALAKIEEAEEEAEEE